MILPYMTPWIFSVLFCILLAFGIFISWQMSLILSLFLALWLPWLRVKRGIVFIFLFLCAFMPIFPDLGIEILGRNIQWFDVFILVLGAFRFFHPPENPLKILLGSSGIFLFFLFISILFSPDKLISFREWISFAVNFFLVFWCICDFDTAALKLLCFFSLIPVIPVQLTAIWQKLNGFSFPSVKDGETTIRLGVPGTFEDSLILSMYSGICVVLSIMVFVRFKDRLLTPLSLFCVVFSLIGLRLSLSRNGIVILVASALFFLVLRFIQWSKDYKTALKIPLWISFGPFLLFFLIKILPSDLYYRIVSVFYLASKSNDPVIFYNIRSTLGRLENYKEAVSLFFQNPIQGIGLGMYPHLTAFEDADGFYTGLAAETGLIGIIGFLFFFSGLVFCLYRLLKRKYSPRQELWNQWICALAFALILVSFFEPVFKIQVISFLFFMFLGASLQESPKKEL